MSFTRVNPSGFTVGGGLTSAQMNTLDIDHSNTLDKTNGDTVQGAVNIGPTGSINIPVLSALNWNAPATVDATFAAIRGVFRARDQVWCAVGNNQPDAGVASADYGKTWGELTLGSSLTLQDVACNPATGDTLITTSTSRSVYYGPFVSFNALFTAFTNVLSATGTGTCAFDVQHNTWIAAYRVGATGIRLDTMPTSNPIVAGAAFIPSVLPSTWTAYTGSNDPRVACGTSAPSSIVACFFDENAALLRIIQSADGGKTWTPTDLVTSFTPTQIAKPVFDPLSSTWYIAVSKTGTRATQVFFTDSRGAWTSSSWTTNDFCAQGFVVLGGWLVAVNDDGRIAVSPASGASMAWAWQGKAFPASSPVTASAGSGGLGIFNPSARQFCATLMRGCGSEAGSPV